MDTQLALNLIQTGMIVLATVFAIQQLRENTRVRRVDVIDRAFDYTSTLEIRKARRMVRDHEILSDISKLPPEQIDSIELVLSGWARVSALLELDVFGPKERNLLFQTYSLSIDYSWAKLKNYVERRRQRTGLPDYWRNVESLAKQARAWREARGLPTWTQQHDSA